MVGQQAPQAHGRLAAQVPLGLPPGGDAVDGGRLRPGEEVEGGRRQEGTGDEAVCAGWFVCVFGCVVENVRVPLQLVRTCARHHQEQKLSAERSKKEEEMHLRHIASTIAREVEFFWANIEQVLV